VDWFESSRVGEWGVVSSRKIVGDCSVVQPDSYHYLSANRRQEVIA